MSCVPVGPSSTASMSCRTMTCRHCHPILVAMQRMLITSHRILMSSLWAAQLLPEQALRLLLLPLVLQWDPGRTAQSLSWFPIPASPRISPMVRMHSLEAVLRALPPPDAHIKPTPTCCQDHKLQRQSQDTGACNPPKCPALAAWQDSRTGCNLTLLLQVAAGHLQVKPHHLGTSLPAADIDIG